MFYGLQFKYGPDGSWVDSTAVGLTTDSDKVWLVRCQRAPQVYRVRMVGIMTGVYGQTVVVPVRQGWAS